MNAHDRLRLYLEQRRELGESELVLDALPVDAVLKMIGAPLSKSIGASAQSTPTNRPPSDNAASGPSSAQRAAVDDAGEISTPVTAPVNVSAPSDPPPRFDNTVPTDWRSALSGLKPGAPQRASEKANADVGANAPSANAAAAAHTSAAKAAPTTSVQPEVSVTPAETARAQSANTQSETTTSSRVGSQIDTSTVPSWLINLGLPFGLTANPPADAKTTSRANAAASIDELATVIASCRECSLGALAINPVPGEGNHRADFVCVGEAPGQTEDETGRPFVGAAGQLLTKILAAIQLQREDVFICNVLKHRPPGNRNPAPDEIHACTPYLTRQLSLVQPKVILALGTFAAQTLLNTTTSLGKLRGQVHRYQGVPLIVTYHPAALLRNEAWKRPTWDDVKLARRVLDAARLNDSAPQS